MRVPVMGIARAALAAAAGAGLVVAANAVPGALALGPAGETDRAVAGRTAAVRGAALVCPGPERMGTPGIPDVRTVASVAATAAPLRALTGLKLPSEAGSLTISGMPSGGSSAPVTERGKGTTRDFAAAGAATVSGTGSLAPGLAATQSWYVGDGERRSFGTVACGQAVATGARAPGGPPTRAGTGGPGAPRRCGPGGGAPAAADAWLVGGGGAPGRQERLVLTNPGGNAVTVDLTLHGAKGPVVSPSGKGIVVPGRGRVSFLLDSISGAEASPTVHVVATGGLVHTVLNDSWLDGTVSAGADDAVPAAPPSRRQVIPGVAVDGRALLRVAVPGDGEAVVQVRVLTEKGPRALPRDSVVRVAGGSTRDVDLSGLATGVYGVEVRADKPVVAGALVQRRDGSKAGDYALTASTPPITGVAGVPLADPNGAADVGRALLLHSTAEPVNVEVVTTDVSGKAASQRLTVPADSSVIVRVTDATSAWVHRLSGKGQLRAALGSQIGSAANGLVAVMPLRDAPLRTTSVGLREAGP